MMRRSGSGWERTEHTPAPWPMVLSVTQMVRCSQCGKEFDRKEDEGRIVSISGSIMGDETTDSYYFCNQCQVYTVEVYHDRFLGEDEVSVRGPLPKSEGDTIVELIRQCSEPWNKKCRCDAHRSYFKGWLD